MSYNKNIENAAWYITVNNTLADCSVTETNSCDSKCKFNKIIVTVIVPVVNVD